MCNVSRGQPRAVTDDCAWSDAPFSTVCSMERIDIGNCSTKVYDARPQHELSIEDGIRGKDAAGDDQRAAVGPLHAVERVHHRR